VKHYCLLPTNINSVWNKEEQPDLWKGFIILPVHKRGNKTDCNNYFGMSLLPTSYNILWNILLSRLSVYIDKIIADHHCGFRHNRSTTDQIFFIHHILEKKWENNKTVHQLFTDFRTVTNQNSIQEEIKRRLNFGNVCYHSVFSSAVKKCKD
jgi:hypothetical protein